MNQLNSGQTISQFNPTIIPMQKKVVNDIRHNYDYSLGIHEILLSGSLGSSKSLLMAHLAVTHCLFNPGAQVLLGRRALPDLKATIFKEIVQHISNDLVVGTDFNLNNTSGIILFKNGSQIMCRSWADRQYSKVRSLQLSAAILEEVIENESMEFYHEIRMRVGRLPKINENFICSATNPGSPSSEFYKYFILGAKDSKTKHVYYSRTEDNPFLPEKYINQLKEDLDPKLARRMIYGEWIEISKEIIYYAYDKDFNFLNKKYEIKKYMPIHICWDFNIGEGKPMSVVLFQFLNGIFHFFAEVIIEGARTLDTCEELAQKGYLDYPSKYYLHGDASGSARDTRTIKSDWDLITTFFSNYQSKEHGKVEFERQVPRSNPPIRTRHNIMNSYFLNMHKKRRLFVYNTCPTLDEGFRLTSFKKGSDNIEDDSKRYQHVTTAAGYGVFYCHEKQKKAASPLREVKIR